MSDSILCSQQSRCDRNYMQEFYQSDGDATSLVGVEESCPVVVMGKPITYYLLTNSLSPCGRGILNNISV
jgi:hypothetical protein